jgi:polar amino acid transport system substrate-binding protein
MIGRRRATIGRAGAVLVTCALAMGWGGGCGARQPTGVAADRPAAAPSVHELRVGIAPIFPPLAFKQGGRIVGIEADFARRLESALGTTLTLVETPWDELIPSLRDGRVDLIMSGMSITEARAQLVAFAHPYLHIGQMALLRRRDAARFRSRAALDRHSTPVGFVRDTTGATYAREHLSHATLRGFASVDDGVAALRAGTIDAFIQDGPTVWRLTAAPGGGGPGAAQSDLTGWYEPLTDEYLAWAVRQDDGALRLQLNRTLKQWNDTGVLVDVLDDWITVGSPRGGERVVH